MQVAGGYSASADVRVVVVGTAQQVTFRYDAYGMPDKFSLESCNARDLGKDPVLWTSGLVSYLGQAVVQNRYGDQQLLAVVDTYDTGTAWEYVMEC